MTGYIDTDLTACALPEVAPDGEVYRLTFAAPVGLLPVEAKRVWMSLAQLGELVRLARLEVGV